MRKFLTFIWVLTNRKSEERRCKVQNEAFGYWKVTVDRPLRLTVDLSPARLERLERTCAKADVGENGNSPLPNLPHRVFEALGAGPHLDFNAFMAACDADADKHGVRLTAKRRKLLQGELCDTSEDAAPVLKKVHNPGKATPDPIHGLFEAEVGSKHCVVEYEPDTALRDSGQVPLLEDGGIEAFFRREVLPYTPDAWIDPDKTLVGYEISFARHYYQPPKLRTLEEISLVCRQSMSSGKFLNTSRKSRRRSTRPPPAPSARLG